MLVKKLFILGILWLLFISGCNKNAEMDKDLLDENTENDRAIDNAAYDDVVEKEIDEIICFENDEYNISYNKLVKEFYFESLSANWKVQVKCPDFWKDGTDNLIDMENVYYDAKLGLLEVFFDIEGDKKISFYFKIESNQISFIDVEEYRYFRNFPYRGKGNEYQTKLTDEVFGERVWEVLNIYDVSMDELIWRTSDEIYENDRLELYFNQENEQYYVFLAFPNQFDENDFYFYYSECALENTDELYKIGDPYSLTGIDGKTAEELGYDPCEDYKYDCDLLISYNATTDVEGYENLLECNYKYDDNGELIEWEKHQNTRAWGTFGMTRMYHCTVPGQCSSAIYTVSHGSQALYYVYLDGSSEPLYIIVFDDFGSYLQVFSY